MAAPLLPSRRAFVGSAVLAGLGGLFRPAVAAELRKNQKRAILVWMSGGPSQFETWDPKPGQWSAGPHATIPTAIPGIRFDEYMPRLARLANRMVVVRTMTSKSEEHEQATVTGMSGSPPRGNHPAPSWLSVCAHEVIDDDTLWPAVAALGQPTLGDYRMPGGGFLGPRYDPLPCPGDGKPPQGFPTSGADVEMVRRREVLRDRLGSDFRFGHDAERLAGHDAAFGQIGALLERSRMFDLSRLPIKRVEQYGNTPLGRDCLLACQLVEQGVPFVLVASPKLEWDLHTGLKTKQPKITTQFDTAVGALVDDLIARGLWEDTLLVLMGEFGRSPNFGRLETGRDHWSKCWSMSFGGAGTRGGVVVGATTDEGTVKDRPVTIHDLLVTFYRALGVDPRKEVDVQGRPTPFVERGMGEPIGEVL
jgi:Protein of unknown function (DUF1501)